MIAQRFAFAEQDRGTGFDFIEEKDIPQMVTWALQEANPTYPVPVVYDRARCEAVIRLCGSFPQLRRAA